MPRILSFEEVSAYLEHIRLGEGLTRSARKLGLDPKLFRDARKTNPEFDEMVRAAEAEAAEPVETALYLQALQGEPWAVKLWLERRSSERWGPPATTVKVEHGLAPQVGRLVELAQRLEERRQMLGLGAGDDGIIEAEVVD